MQHRRKEDIEQQVYDNVALTEALLDAKPLLEIPIACTHASSNVIVKLADDRDHDRWNATSLQNFRQKDVVGGAARFYAIDEAHVEGILCLWPSSCSR